MIPFEEGRKVGYTVAFRTGCWLWVGSLKKNGYAQVWSSQKRCMVRAHRVYWERVHGPVPDGLELDHLCRRRSCVNPSHMEAVSHTENVRRGLLTTLSDEDVRAIRLEPGNGRDVAKLFGVHPSTVSKIKNGKIAASVS